MTPQQQYDAEQAVIKRLHALYCELTSRDEQLNHATKYDWQQWLLLLKHRPEWTPENMLRLIIAYRLTEIRQGRRHPASLAFRNLIRDIAQADDLIADALAARRNAQKARMPPEKTAVLKATGRPTELKTQEAVSAAEVISRVEFAERLKVWRESGGLEQ